MTLEQQVCSLESAKRIEELGVPQNSLFHWFVVVDDYDVKPRLQYDRKNPQGKSGEYKPHLGGKESRGKWEEKYYSAFTVAELGELMKRLIDEKGIHTEWNYVWKKWTCYLQDMNCETESQEDGDTEAEARAKMLIYLLENKLITL